jgi:hypothetical protein
MAVEVDPVTVDFAALTLVAGAESAAVVDRTHPVNAIAAHTAQIEIPDNQLDLRMSAPPRRLREEALAHLPLDGTLRMTRRPSQIARRLPPRAQSIGPMQPKRL